MGLLEDVLRGEREFDRRMAEKCPLTWGGAGPGVSIAGVGRGWWALVGRASEALETLNKQITPNRIIVGQVKEKFGALSFYAGFRGEVAQWAAAEAGKILSRCAAESRKTCEWCGEPGSESSDGFWVKTLCEPCKERRSHGVRYGWDQPKDQAGL